MGVAAKFIIGPQAQIVSVIQVEKSLWADTANVSNTLPYTTSSVFYFMSIKIYDKTYRIPNHLHIHLQSIKSFILYNKLTS